jgi:guanine nucleotide-binding protein subunit alpha-12
MLLSKSVSSLVCCLTQDEKLQMQKSKQIDQEIALAKQRSRRTQKIVLLGVGESGKSTFLKQMQIIHGTGLTEPADLKKYRSIIYDNIIRGTIGLINGKRAINLNWSKPTSTENLKTFIRLYENLNYSNSLEIQPSDFTVLSCFLRALWNDNCMKEAYNRRREFPGYFVENLLYYMENLDRIADINYTPTQADILRSRRATMTINEVEIKIRSIPFLFIDVGGQRTQRQKWQQCFSDVTAILFLVSSSEYDEYLREDHRVSRLDESCKVFETLVNLRHLANVEFILFLNKHDLLKDKLESCNIKDYCKDFKGNQRSINDVENYLQNRFLKLKNDDAFANLDRLTCKCGIRSIYAHFTTAVDTNNIRTIFEIVRNMIFEKNIGAIMLN